MYGLESITNDAVFGEDVAIPINLITKLMSQETLSSFDPYIQSMVKSYVRRKKKIIINLEGLDEIQETLKGVVLKDKIVNVKTSDSDWNPDSILSSGINLISPNILSMFPNISSISIKTGDHHNSYPFDMLGFVDIIEPFTICGSIKVHNMTDSEKYHGKSWIAKMWETKQSMLVKEYKERKFEILFGSMSEQMIDIPVCHDFLPISRV